jgi:hypothetical protein
MKKTVALAILGVAAATTAFGQGHVLIFNYGVAPYNQVVWDAAVPTVGGTAVNDTAVQLTIFYAAGSVADANLLTSSGPAFSVNPGYTFVGPSGSAGGYYDAQSLVTPATGLYTIQIRASGNTAQGDVFGSSALYEVTTISTSLPADVAPISAGLIVAVPEPTTFALAGLGAAALLIFRRRD